MRHSRLLIGLMAAVWAQAPAAAADRPWDIVFTELPAGRMPARARAGGMLRAEYGESGRLVRLDRDGSERVLTPQFTSAADPAVSFDARRILFAGKKSAGESWNIYEMQADGSGVRQITRDLGNCRSPIYQPDIFYLDDPGPMPQIAFVSDAPGTLSEYGAAPATAVYSARLDGSGVRRLTYNPSGAFDPVMLPDGRLAFSGWQRAEGSHLKGRIELLATNIDGTDYAAFSGGQGGRVKQMACVTTTRLVVFVDAGAVAGDGAGPLAAVDLRRNLHSYSRLPLGPAYLYHSPSPLPAGEVLVSRRPASGGTLGIVRLELQTGRAVPVFERPGMELIQAQALVARKVPDGRSSVVDEKVEWAKLYCLNLYESDLSPNLWPRGLVKRIRVLEGLPRRVEDGQRRGDPSPLIGKRFLGELDADADGSFHIEIPANLPVQLQALDEDGMALRSSAWIWTKNKERRGCIGCHEDGERTPENVMATALTRPAAMLTLAPERRRTVEFGRDIAPILRRRCTTGACHSAAPLKLGAEAYRMLLAKDPKTGVCRYVTPGVARTSPLVWVLFGRNTSRPWDLSRGLKAMPHQSLNAVPPEEKRAIVEWIDLGAHDAAGGQR